MKERMEASVEKNNKTITIEVREVSQELEIIKEKPRDTLMVLVPSLAIEYWGRIADMYQMVLETSMSILWIKNSL